jgi:hypothetical protein
MGNKLAEISRDSPFLTDRAFRLSRQPSKKHAIFSPSKKPQITYNPFNINVLRRQKARSQHLPRVYFLKFSPCPSDQVNVCLEHINQRQGKPHMIHATIGLPC